MHTQALEELGFILNGSFFGWGTGGAPKIPKVLQILQDLGYSKVAVVFDSNKAMTRKRQKNSSHSIAFSASQLMIFGTNLNKKQAGKGSLMDSAGKIKHEHKDRNAEITKRRE